MQSRFDGWGLRRFARAACWMLLPVMLAGCPADRVEPSASIAAYRDRALLEQQAQVDGERPPRGASPADPLLMPQEIQPAASQQGSMPAKAALLTPTTSAPASMPTPAEILGEIPDPSHAEQVFADRLERVRGARESRVTRSYENVVRLAKAYLSQLDRPKKVRLTLAEVIQRTLANNYLIRIEAFGPAISETQLIEAEAAFDAIFFLDAAWAPRDPPERNLTPTGATKSDTRSYGGGVRKLLPTGMGVEASLRQTRGDVRFPQKQSQVYDPAYDTSFSVQFTQPLLRGFGLDYNRAPIEVSRVGVKISREQFLAQVRDRLFDVESAYWQLSRARRQAMIQAESVAQNQVTYETVDLRRILDASKVEINNSRSRWKSSEVQFQITVKLVRDAEDVLKNLLNDPELKLSEDVEIIPTDTPLAGPQTVDHFAEVRSALDERNEIRQAKYALEQARIQSQRAKGDTLPRLDAFFQYEVLGTKQTADDSFDQLTSNNYISYNVGVTFEVPIGQRQTRAAYRRAELQERQAVVRIQQTTDLVVQEVNNAVREMVVGWMNIPTQLDSVLAADRNLRALQERGERVDPSYLETELSGVEQLNNTRSVLLRLVTDYNIAIVALERAKGTLLRYNNVVAVDESHRR